MADHAAKGKQLLAESKFTEAVDAYTKALQNAPTSPVYLIGRSTAYQRAKQYQESLADADAAVVHANTRAKRELIVEGQTRRGIALYNLGRYADAQFVLTIVKRMDEKEKQHAMFLNMAGRKLAALGEDDEAAKVTVQEKPELPTEAASEVRRDSPTQVAAGTNGKPQPAAIVPTPKDKIRHDWYENPETLTFSLLAKGVPKDKVQVDIQEQSLGISFPIGNTGSDYDFTLEPLFAAVQPEKSTVKVFSTKIEIMLVKAKPGLWHKLEMDEESRPKSQPTTSDAAPTDDLTKRAVYTTTKAAGPSYPTSSKHGPKDWDKITKDLGKSDAKPGSAAADDDYEGGDEANHFFKQLFKGSTPEVQRAMMKSYTESNGTALSTNWEEVSKAKVETSPPDGMEAKTWG